MAVVIATYPPLGQVTQLQNSNVAIHAVVEVPHELRTEQWKFVLWYSDGNEGKWTGAEFTPDLPDNRPTDLHAAKETTARLHFTAKVAVHSLLTFTVKFRQGTGEGEDEDEWQWARTEQGSEDGIVVIDRKPTRDDDAEELPDLIQELNPDLKWKSHMSQAPRTRLWSIEGGVDGAKEDESAFADVPLGIPWGRSLR